LFGGLAVALMDSSRGFDATGITAAGLIVGGAIAAFIDGSGSFAWAALLTLLVGIWVPLLESPALPTSALPLLFAAIGAFAAALSRRLVVGASPRDGGFTVR
jgi:hypothetical protein